MIQNNFNIGDEVFTLDDLGADIQKCIITEITLDDKGIICYKFKDKGLVTFTEKDIFGCLKEVRIEALKRLENFYTEQRDLLYENTKEYEINETDNN